MIIDFLFNTLGFSFLIGMIVFIFYYVRKVDKKEEFTKSESSIGRSKDMFNRDPMNDSFLFESFNDEDSNKQNHNNHHVTHHHDHHSISHDNSSFSDSGGGTCD